MTGEEDEDEDEIELSRFVEAQNERPRGARRTAYELAMSELEAGRKTGHWIWFVFPQCDGVPEWHGATPSEAALWFGIAGLEEAGAYLAHDVLGPRLVRAVGLALRCGPPDEAFGPLDAAKLRSSLTLFSLVPGADPVFAEALDRLFAGARCEATLALTGATRR